MAKVEVVQQFNFRGEVMKPGKTVEVPDDRVAGMLRNGQAKLPGGPDPRREAEKKEAKK